MPWKKLERAFKPVAVRIGRNAAQEWLATGPDFDLPNIVVHGEFTQAEQFYFRLRSSVEELDLAELDRDACAEFWISVLGKAEPDEGELYGFEQELTAELEQRDKELRSKWRGEATPIVKRLIKSGRAKELIAEAMRKAGEQPDLDDVLHELLLAIPQRCYHGVQEPEVINYVVQLLALHFLAAA